MAGKEVDAIPEATVMGYDPDQFQWQTVHTEQADQVTFDTIGDTLIAEYLGQEVIEFDDPKHEGEKLQFTQLQFMLPGDNPCVVNAGYDLLKAFTAGNVEKGDVVRIQYLKDVDVDQQSPMKSYRVDVAKRP